MDKIVEEILLCEEIRCSSKSSVSGSIMYPSAWAIILAAAVADSPHSVKQELTHEKIRHVVQAAIRIDPASMRSAHFQIDDTTFYYDLGGIGNSAAVHAPAKPLDFPLRAQFTVEAIRKRCANWGPVSRQTMEEYLRQAEIVISSELKVIATDRGNRETLLKRLDSDDRRVDEILLTCVGSA